MIGILNPLGQHLGCKNINTKIYQQDNKHTLQTFRTSCNTNFYSRFYLPHGVTIDKEENIWLTDVALHQVFKFPPVAKNERTPLLALGKAFVPGNSAVRFCKPTSVAVTSWGDFFVADGYCNSRLIKFNKAGVKIMEIGHATFNFGGKQLTIIFIRL